MELMKVVSIFCILFLNHCMSNHVVPEVVQNPNGYNNQDCLCFDKTAPTFPDILGPTGKEWERLVVYFYKNPLTNEVQLHIPNHYKQYSFPDLSVDGNDLLLKGGKETFSDILNTNPHFIVLSHEKPNWNANTVNFDFTTDNVPVTVKPQTVTENVNVHGNVPATNWHPKPINLVSNVVDYVPDIKGVLNVIDNVPVTNWNVHSVTDGTTAVDSPVTSWNLNTITGKPDVVDNVPQTNWNSNAVKVTPSVVDSGPVTNWESWTDKHQPGSVNINGPTQWTNDLISILTKNEKNVPNIKNLDIKAHRHIDLETFDDWFEHQIRVISHLSQSPLVDVPALKVFIEKTLHDNHIYLSSAGVLIDIEGNVLDLSNLKLRPILIGDSISYGNLPYNKGGQYILPTNLKYLEAILITLVYPPKVLGAIPIGKTYIPRSPYKNEFYYWNARTNQFGCGHGQCPSHSAKKEHETKSSKSTKSRKNSAVTSQVHSTYGHGNSFKNLETISNSLNRNPQMIDDSLTHFGGFNPVLDDLVNGPKSKNVQSGTQKFHASTDNTVGQETANVFNLPPVYWEEVDYVEELPGFRIIGGNAATGSGTPVSSKGRSGFGPDP